MSVAFWILPRFGRRPLLIWGGVGQLVLMTLFCILISETHDNQAECEMLFLTPLPIRRRDSHFDRNQLGRRFHVVCLPARKRRSLV